MKELELRSRAETEQANSYTSSPRFDVAQNIALVPHFGEKEVEKYFSHFERVATTLAWPKEFWTLLLQCVLTGRAQEAYSSLTLTQSSDYAIVKAAILLMIWSLRPKDRGLEGIVRWRSRHLWSLLEKRKSFSLGGSHHKRL